MTLLYPSLTNCVSYSPSVFLHPSILSLPPSISSRHQQYECKWYIPLADLTFQTLDDSDSCPSIQVLPEHEIEEMKIKISVLKSEIQKEKVILFNIMCYSGLVSKLVWVLHWDRGVKPLFKCVKAKERSKCRFEAHSKPPKANTLQKIHFSVKKI